MTINIKRIYDPFSKSDGYRILADRLWPRGIKKEDAQLDLWLKEIAPSTALRKWFDHDPEKWKQFVVKYHTELRGSAALQELIALTKKHQIITLLYAAKNEEYNQAVVLRDLFKKHK